MRENETLKSGIKKNGKNGSIFPGKDKPVQKKAGRLQITITDTLLSHFFCVIKIGLLLNRRVFSHKHFSLFCECGY